MIHVIATVQVHPGRREEFLKHFHAVVPLVRAEQGCLEYGPAIDLDAGLPVPTPMRSDVVVIVEKWTSLETLKDHLAASHMHDYRAKVKEVVQSVSLQVLQPA